MICNDTDNGNSRLNAAEKKANELGAKFLAFTCKPGDEDLWIQVVGGFPSQSKGIMFVRWLKENGYSHTVEYKYYPESEKYEILPDTITYK